MSITSKSVSGQVPKSAFAIGYLILVVLVFGDALFAQEYLYLTPSWLAWYAAAAIALAGSAYFFFKADWRRVFRQIPIELSLLIALMLGSVLWSNYPSQTISSFLIQAGVVMAALFFIAMFSWRQIFNLFANTIRGIIFAALGYELFLSILSLMAQA